MGSLNDGFVGVVKERAEEGVETVRLHRCDEDEDAPLESGLGGIGAAIIG